MNFIFPRNGSPSRTSTNRTAKNFVRDVRRPLLALLISTSLWSGLISPAVSAKGKKPPAKPKAAKPIVSSTLVTKRPTSAPTANNTMPVYIEINGTGFGKSLASVTVELLTNIESGVPTPAAVRHIEDTKISATADLPTVEGASIHGSVALKIGDESVSTNNYSFDLAVPPLQAKPRSVEVDIRENKNPQNPTLHYVQITPRDPADKFAADPLDSKAMKVQILPPGATNVIIEPISTPSSALVTFTAAEGFKVQDVLVTVFDSNGTTGHLPKAPKQVEKEVKITRVDVVSLQRRDGFGRLKIEGEGFGSNYSAPPVSADLELICDPANRASHADEREDTNRRSNTEAITPDTSSLCWENGTRRDFKGFNQGWRKDMAASLNVQLVPRNPDLRVERTLIMYADDRLIDVYFEFSHWQNYSEPFRLDSVSVSVTKEEPASALTAVGPGAAPPTTTPKSTKTYLASFPIGPQRDKKLEYRYTVLDQQDASLLFGSGVGDNFYVLQLSVVNNGDKKLVVPLSSIQAEIEWSYKEEKTTIFDEGPATLSPLKLSAVTSYFDTFQKTRGRKARLFNILDGVVTLGASLVPVFGSNIEKGTTILSGGLIPGLRKSLGDLSSQQLQNLTAMSWDSVEEIPAGGAKEKFIYIQRSDQSFSNKTDRTIKINKSIKSIQGLEVSGFVVNDSSPAAAVPQP